MTNGNVIVESNKTVPFENIYEIQREIGRRPFQPIGSCSYVSTCVERGTGYLYAAKVIQKKFSSVKSPREINVMLKLKHENIVRLKEVFETDAYLFLVLEHVNGVELFKRLSTLPFYTEQIIALYFRQMLEGIRFLHQYGIVHKNLKPENILLSSYQPEATIKITDASLATFLVEDMDVELVCCNTIYCPPELLLSRKVDKTFDLWSLGILLYIMLSGTDPFNPKIDGELYRAILLGDINYSGESWDQVSLNGKDAVKRLLVVDPRQRALTSQMLEHPWVTGKNATTEHLTYSLKNLEEFNIRRTWMHNLDDKSTPAADSLLDDDNEAKDLGNCHADTRKLSLVLQSGTECLPLDEANNTRSNEDWVREDLDENADMSSANEEADSEERGPSGNEEDEQIADIASGEEQWIDEIYNNENDHISDQDGQSAIPDEPLVESINATPDQLLENEHMSDQDEQSGIPDEPLVESINTTPDQSLETNEEDKEIDNADSRIDDE